MLSEVVRRLHEADVRWSERYLVRTPFHPGFWVRRRLERAIGSQRDRVCGVLLDVGCGLKPYEKVLGERVNKYIGLEYSPESGYRGNKADVYADAAAIPLASGSVDTVLCTELLEHVPNPDMVIEEIARVLKPGGILLCTAPFFYPIHDALDFFRYSPMGVATMMRRHSFQVESVAPLSGTGLTLAILFNIYWFDIGFMWTKWLYLFGLILRPVLLLFVFIVNMCGWLLERMLPSHHMSFNHLTIAHQPEMQSHTRIVGRKIAPLPIEAVG